MNSRRRRLRKLARALQSLEQLSRQGQLHWLAVLRLPVLERRFALVLLATLAVAMLPLTWEDHKQVWFILAVLLGMSQAPGVGWPEGTRRAAPPRPALRRPLSGRMEPIAAARRHAGPEATP